MTALLADLGNTRWKLAVAGDGGIGQIVSAGYDDEGGLQAALRAHTGRVDAVLLASVAGAQRTADFAAAVRQTLDLPVRQLRSTDALPDVRSGYRKPEQLGVDRLLAMVAARALHRGPLCVVDAGTAVTIDFVDARGRHLGGFILPGLRLARDCLLAHTAIPRDAVVDAQAELGRDTPTAVALGTRQAVAAIVERFTVGGASVFAGHPATTLVGGGDAAHFLSLMPQPCSELDHLVLRGLAAVAAAGEPY
jgi:type III pantothenate kinase